MPHLETYKFRLILIAAHVNISAICGVKCDYVGC